MKILL
ncbi:hypothetical protein VULLAG_LOCUS20107 [Vulpes lagopus]|jgi:hypothetical protein